MNLSKRTELRRIPHRGSHDWTKINQILDAGSAMISGISLKKPILALAICLCEQGLEVALTCDQLLAVFLGVRY